MANARHATVALTYNGKSAAQMAQYLSSFQYTDVASGSSDSISIELNDPDRRWIGGWFPQKGDKLKPTIQMFNWNRDGGTETIKCGTFVVDDFSFKGGPIKLNLKALAIPSLSGFKTTERTHTFENTNIKAIGEVIAQRNGLTLYYDAPDIAIESVAQDKQNDCSFYSDLVVKYGLALKLYNDRLVVFNEATYEAAKSVATLSEADFEPGWTWNTTLAGTYTGVDYQYTHTEKNQTFTEKIGSGDRILTCNDEANNQTEATIIALAKLNAANKGTTTMKITLRAAKRITATSCVDIVGLGNLNGKYFVEEVTTTVGGGTKMSLSLRRVEKRFTKSIAAPATPAPAAAAPAAQTTTPKKGEQYTLTATKVGYYTAAEAKAGRVTGGHPTATVKAGTYYIFNTSQGMLNLSRSASSPGSWVNPN